MTARLGIDACPLQWPAGWKRTPPPQRQRSVYRVSFAGARDQLAREVAKLAVRPSDVVISTNVPLRRDGLPYAGMREPDDPGVAAYWVTSNSQQWVIACDAWVTVRENMRAVGLAVEALRMLERTKATEILARAFQGFAALPPARPDWAVTLQVRVDATREDIERAYRGLAKSAHPDGGGSHEAMLILNAARAAALGSIGGTHGS